MHEVNAKMPGTRVIFFLLVVSSRANLKIELLNRCQPFNVCCTYDLQRNLNLFSKSITRLDKCWILLVSNSNCLSLLLISYISCCINCWKQTNSRIFIFDNLKKNIFWYLKKNFLYFFIFVIFSFIFWYFLFFFLYFLFFFFIVFCSQRTIIFFSRNYIINFHTTFSTARFISLMLSTAEDNFTLISVESVSLFLPRANC